MKKIVVILYEEGASGLTHVNRCGGNFALRRMVADCNAAVAAIIETGAEAYVCDVYGKGRDIIDDELTKKAKRISLKELTTLCENGVDGAILVGAHAMNSAENAFCSYSVNEAAWQEYTVNGKEYGDIGLATMFFGAYGVPIVAVSGDEAAVKECQELAGDIPCAIVKTAKKRNITDSCMPEAEAEALIKKACALGVKNSKNYKPYVVEAPYCVRVLYKRADYCDEAIWCYLSRGGLTRISALVAEKHVEKIVNYNDLRI